MIYKNIKYIDPTISTAGDGSSASKALKTFPKCNEIPDSTLYIIRRTTTALEIKDNASWESAETNTTCRRLGVIRMPKAKDIEYELVADDVKAAWNGDADVRPAIKAADMCHWQFDKIFDLELKGIELQHGMSSPDMYELRPMIMCSNNDADPATKRHGVLTFSNCVLKSFKDWTEAIEGCGQFISFNKLNDLNIVDNIIWNASMSGGGPGGGSSLIEIGSVYHNVLIQNNILHIATNGSAGGGPDGGSPTITGNRDGYNTKGANMNEFIVLNNKLMYWLQEPDEYSGSAGGGVEFGGRADYVYVKGFEVSEEKIVGTPKNISISTSLLHTPEAVMMGWYEDIQVSMPSFRAPGYTNLIKCDGYNDLSKFTNQVKNVHISMDTAPLGPLPDFEGPDSEPDYSNGFALLLDNVANADDISVHCPEGKALKCEDCRIKAKNIDGAMALVDTYMEMTTNTMNSTKYNVIWFDYRSIVSIDRITVPENYNIDVVKINGNYDEGSSLWVGECNKPLMLSKGKLRYGNDTTGNGVYDGGGLFISSDGAVGRFAQYGPGYYADTWACVRQGSTAVASLRVKSKRTQLNSNAMRTVKNPGSLLFKNSVPAGDHKVTIYFASSEIVDLPEKIKFELETDNGVYKSDVCGRIVETADKWIGAGTVKSYKCVMNVNCAGTCSITGSMTTIFFGELGTIFLDPIIEVE